MISMERPSLRWDKQQKISKKIDLTRDIFAGISPLLFLFISFVHCPEVLATWSHSSDEHDAEACCSCPFLRVKGCVIVSTINLESGEE
jgi:hypothetical protein